MSQVIASRQNRWLHAVRKTFVVAGCLSALLFLLVTFTPLVPWWAHQLSGRMDNQRGDILIVLAAADSTDEFLSYSSYLRSKYAVRAWQEGWVKTIVISGGANHTVPVAQMMAEFMRAEGIPPQVIRTETGSRSTRENALFTASMVQAMPGTKVLLTSDYHMYRAKLAFEKAGLRVTPRPFPDIFKRSTSRLQRWPGFLELCEESVKIAYYRLRGWI